MSFVAESRRVVDLTSASPSDDGDSIIRFNTATGAATQILSTTDHLGDISRFDDGTLVFVRYPAGAPLPGVARSYEIDTLFPAGSVVVVARPQIPASAVSIDVDAAKSVFVRSETGGFDVKADGSVVQAPSHPSIADRAGWAVVAANRRGDLLS